MANPRPREPRRQSQDTATKAETVTARSLALLAAFSPERPRLSLSEMARRANLPVSTAHRLVAELVEWGAVERVHNEYVIGQRLWKLGLLAPIRQNIAEIAAPHMQDVLFVTHNVVNLFVLESSKVLLLERISGTKVGTPFRKVGDPLPLHASAAGKVMLAFSRQDLMSQAINNMTSLTKYTITSPAALQAAVAEVKRSGYAISSQETGLDNHAVAVPVLDAMGYAVAALGVVHQKAPAIGSVVPVLRIAARGIARRLTSVELS
ncbi:IclR family transcriptional regulator [Enteractinococcus coprophilus]|uniref:IclR family transcriptional regulator n=1 Tax=Enteractinococcus coprophilus TaxID=1027633 RepID=A0A543AG78_9MICC|nr:IclR family transcriptional regulator [Enteractinococcus coprophilus]TQL71585.1 IclR family transcriptional regulator [Enteractinococcus coprophilus]